MYNSYLAHYGIAGQQWGVRRFQNEDGTLTEEGRKRYLKEASDHDRDVYNHMTAEGREVVDRYLTSGKGKNLHDAMQKAMVDTAQKVRSADYKHQMMRHASGFISGYGTKLLGNIVFRKGHPLLGSFLRGLGSGTMVGNVIGASVRTIANSIEKQDIANTKISDIRVVDDKKHDKG